MEFSQKISFCGKCSSAIIRDNLGNTKSTIKPLKFHTKWENVTFAFLNKTNINKAYNYSNYKGFMKIRHEFINNIKQKCNDLHLNLKTYFLSLDYFLQICSILTSFSTESLF